MAEHMRKYEAEDYVSGNVEGYARVKLGNYAFISESPAAEYQVNQGCDLVVVGKPFKTSYYGFGFPPITGSPLKKRVDAALLRLEESSKMDTLKKKWWKEDAKSCKVGSNLVLNNVFDHQDDSLEDGLDWERVGGVFLFLGGGLVLTLVVMVLELVKRNMSGKQRKIQVST